ncbi:hypothetical protein AMECASPLE_032079 [Ameca splendens]|uniref:Uncharacterized protein n=1 Tax=Ameca splendens TaxID=208324 RepID=A0ABV0ZG64_9TELE
MHQEQVKLSAGNADQTPAPLVQRPNGPYWSTPHRAARGTQSNAFSRSTKHMWTGWENSHENLECPAEGVELVQCSTAGTKTTPLLLKPRFDSPIPWHRPYQGG